MGLEITAGIIAILQLSKVVVGYIRDLKNASTDSTRLLVEITHGLGLLFMLKDLVAQDESGDVGKTLGAPQGPLVQFKQTLERLAKLLEPAVGLKKAGRAVAWPFKKEEIRDILHQIERQKTHFILALELDDLELSRKNNVGINEIKDAVVQKSRDDQESKILDWLSTLQPQKKHRDVSDRRCPSTGQWLLENENFRSWRDDPHSMHVLWCHGVPGAGKTILSSLVIDSLIALPEVSTAFFYYDYGDQDIQSPAKVVASLLRQCASSASTLPSPIHELFKTFGKRQDTPSLQVLESALLSTCQRSTQTYIVIDALDECHETYRTPILQLLKRLEKFAKFFITSRHYPQDIQKKLGAFPQVEILASNSDIRVYLEREIDQDDSAQEVMGPALKAEILKEISRRAQGMSVALSERRKILNLIRTILDQTTKRGMRRLLEDMPTGLEAKDRAFRDTVDRIQKQGESRSQLGMTTLMWLTHARRPFLLDELREALAVLPGDTYLDEDCLPSYKTVVSCCLGLVTVDKQSSTLRLVHFSVQEYLRARQRELFPLAEQMITTICLTYLLFQPFESYCRWCDQSQQSRHPFLAYAANHWADHSQICPSCENENLAYRFLTSDFHLACSARYINDLIKRSCLNRHIGGERKSHDEVHSTTLTGLHIAAWFGLRTEVQLLLQRQCVDTNSITASGLTPLHLAASNGHGMTVQLLLAANADVNAGSPPALLEAVRYGHVDVIEKLLAAKADVTVVDAEGWTALHHAAADGHVNVVEMLLAATADVNAGHNVYETPLQLAAEGGHVKVVEKLLAVNADVNAVNYLLATTRQFAAREGHAKVVQIQLAANADVTLVNIKGRTAMYRATVGNHTRVGESWPAAEANRVRVIDHEDQNLLPLPTRDSNFGGMESALAAEHTDYLLDFLSVTALRFAADSVHSEAVMDLLDAGVDIHVYSSPAETALQLAADRVHVKVMETLLAANTDVKAYNGSHQTAVQTAAERIYEKSVEVLRAANADVNAVDGRGQTALHPAAKRDHIKHLETLLAANADVNYVSNEGHTALQRAAAEGHAEVVKMLLAANANVNAYNNSHQTALHLAAKRGHVNTVEALLSANADVNVVSNGGNTPLHPAAANGHVEVVEMLLVANADLNAYNGSHQTALQYAADRGHVKIVKTLLAANADVNAVSNKGHTALQRAAKNGHIAVVEMLLAANADVNAVNGEGQTSLHLAAGRKIVEALLTAKADVNVDSNGRGTALHWAAAVGHFKVVEMLLAAHADVNAVDGRGQTALHIAAECGQRLLSMAKVIVARRKRQIVPPGAAAEGYVKAEDYVKVVEILLAANADVNAVDGEGQTALQLAREDRHTRIVDMLENAGRT